MSNETHNEAHHEDHGQTERAKSKTAFQSSFWFVIILVFLFIAAINFVNVMSKGEEGEKTEAKAEGTTTEAHKAEATTTDTAKTVVAPADTTQAAKH